MLLREASLGAIPNVYVVLSAAKDLPYQAGRSFAALRTTDEWRFLGITEELHLVPLPCRTSDML